MIVVARRKYIRNEPWSHHHERFVCRITRSDARFSKGRLGNAEN
jgi:hypothetical protein